MTDIPTITQEEAVEVRARKLLAAEYERLGVKVSARRLLADPGADMTQETAAMNVIAALSPNMDHAVGGVRERLVRSNIATMQEQVRRCERWGKSHAELDIAIKESRAALATPPVDQDAVRDDGDLAGYQMAFYELAKIMGIGARVATPGHVWRTEMLPRLLAAFAATPPVNQDAVREALESAEKLIDDMSRFVGQMNLRDYGLFNEAPIKIRKVLRALATPPLDNTGLDAATVERWTCEECWCREYARIQSAELRPTDDVRCVNCKRVYYLPLASGDRS